MLNYLEDYKEFDNKNEFTDEFKKEMESNFNLISEYYKSLIINTKEKVAINKRKYQNKININNTNNEKIQKPLNSI